MSVIEEINQQAQFEQKQQQRSYEVLQNEKSMPVKMWTKGAIIPAAVGVDIGCGMMATRTSLTASDLPDNLHALRSELERLIPME